MKKYIFKTVLCSTLAMSLTTSCELDQYPENSIPSEQSWQKVSDAEQFYVGLLANLRSATGGGLFTVPDIQSDLFNALAGATSFTQEHQWRFTTTQFAGDNNWLANYGLISTANNILDNVDKVVATNDEEQAILNNVKGAAFFARAMAYSSLAPRYCENYDPATADATLGLPLVTNVDVNAKPERSNLKVTYDFILNDIEEAEKLCMDNEDITAPTKNAVTALKARVCLNMKQYEEAIEAATSLFDIYPLTEADDYESLWYEDMGSEIIFQPLMTVDERGGGYGGVYIDYNKAKEVYAPDYVPTQGLMDLYQDDDIRKSIFFAETDLSAKDEVATGYLFYKFPGNPNLRRDNENETNSWVNMHKVIRTSEMYLIAAEASLFKANRDETAALQFLNKLRKTRGTTELFSTGTALDKDMKNEWVREMVGEGVRLNCLKRWNEGVKRMAPQKFSSNMLVNTPASEYTELNIQTNNPIYYKITWEIPSNDLQANSHLIPNWKDKK